MSVKRSDIRGSAIKALVDELKATPCMDCGGQYQSEAMDWDHRPEESKLYEIGAMVGGRYAWELIQTEIAKCDLVCANCHRVRTKHRLNNDESRFYPMPKIPRLSRDIVITEKIDGTNAVVVITGSGEVLPGSKSRWLRPKLYKFGSNPDNHGFAAWVAEHEEELYEGLGEGIHRGEWWGQGIQRGYGLKEKRFSLFNTYRWGDETTRPTCCHVVPVIYHGEFDTLNIEDALDWLAIEGSQAAPGFKPAEGIVIFHTASNQLFKKTILNDTVPKGKIDESI